LSRSGFSSPSPRKKYRKRRSKPSRDRSPEPVDELYPELNERNDSVQDFIKSFAKIKPQAIVTPETETDYEKMYDDFRTVRIGNIDRYLSVLEVEGYIRSVLEQHGHGKGDGKRFSVPQTDYYGTPQHMGYAHVFARSRRLAERLVKTFDGRVFGEKSLHASYLEQP